MNVELLAPRIDTVALSALLNRPPGAAHPFSASRQATLGNLSLAILRDTDLRPDPAAVALAYWLRRSNIERLAEGFDRRCALDPDVVFVPAGRVFHVAPGNVDTVFVYSWALSYLAGNENIVRVSGQQSPLLSGLLGVFRQLMQQDEELAAANSFLTYDHDDRISGVLSQWANHRILWGGDHTVSLLRALPLSPHSSERAFGSKYSWCMISANDYLSAAGTEAEKLASAFFNDVFWFDQMACSSPHMIVWIGSPESASLAIDRFHAGLTAEITRRNFHGGASSAMHRLNHVFDLACETDLTADLKQKEFLGVRIAEGEPFRREICGGGVFFHMRVDSLDQAAAFAQQDHQTVTHFGFTREEMRRFAGLAGLRGADRCVPVGEALAFDANWDGFDLIGDFLRRVTVRTQK